MTDVWAVGDPYESYMGRWSRIVAVKFLDWLKIPAGRRWLDVGCGTGALSAAILAHSEPESLLGIDPSKHFVAWTASRLDDPRARFTVGSATSLPVGSVDVVVSGLVLNFVPDAAAAVARMREAAPSGVVAAYVWDYVGGMQLIRRFWDAAIALDPAAAEKVEALRFDTCRPEPLESLWRDTGLQHVEVRAVEVATIFRDFDDYWTPFLGGQGPAPSYAMALDESARARLRERLRHELQTESDGSIHLFARAWAVRGTS
jgi:SAM-dependent methyltransferase